jgi:hypothetical protein
MKKNVEVERWFAEKKLPNEQPIRRLREILLAADPRISDYVKYGSLVFGYEATWSAWCRRRRRTST